MEMVKQPTDVTGCGVAVIAMLSGSSFESVMTKMEPYRESWFKRGADNMTIPQMKAALVKLVPGYHVRRGKKWPCELGLAAIYVETKHLAKHWVAFDGTQFFDPLSTAVAPTLRINRRVAGYLALYPCRNANPETCEGC